MKTKRTVTAGRERHGGHSEEHGGDCSSTSVHTKSRHPAPSDDRLTRRVDCQSRQERKRPSSFPRIRERMPADAGKRRRGRDSSASGKRNRKEGTIVHTELDPIRDALSTRLAETRPTPDGLLPRQTKRAGRRNTRNRSNPTRIKRSALELHPAIPSNNDYPFDPAH